MFNRILTLILCALLLGGFLFVNANDPKTYNDIGHLSYAATVYNSEQTSLLEEWKDLDKLEIEQAMLRVQWDDNAEDMAEDAISYGNAVTVDVLQMVVSIITSTANSIKDMADAVALASARVSKNIDISYQNVFVAMAIGDRDAAYTHYKEHYDAYVKAYSGSLTLITKGGTPSLLSVDSGLSVPCANPKCSTTYSDSSYDDLHMLVWDARNKHLVTCNIPHYKRGVLVPPNPAIYWNCPDDQRSECPYDFYHKVLCGGCKTWFKNEPNEIRSHWTPCNETVKGTLENLWKTNCRGYYYNCNGDTSADCWNADNHISGGSTPPSDSTPPSENPIVAPPPTPTPPPSPTYHACGVHETSVSGDHSLQASCTSTDSNGNTCTVTSFYACDSHTHSYPTPPPTPTPTPPPEPTPTPPAPTTVACGARGWTGCTIRSSDGNACLVDPCDSGCGSYYWSCSTSGVSWHKTSRTCKRSSCGASYTNCTRGDGTCSGGKYTWHKK